LYQCGKRNVDVVKELEASGFRFRRSGKKYVVEKVFKNLVYARAHACHWALSEKVYEQYASQSITVFQRQRVVSSEMTTPLTAAIKANLVSVGASMVSLGGFRHSRPQPLSRSFPVDPVVDRIVREEISESEVEGYVHSSQVEDLQLMAKGFTVLLEKQNKEFDFETFWHLFVVVSLELPEPRRPERLTPTAELGQVQPSTSCGLLPLNSIYGSCSGSKREMHNSAVAVNVAARAWGGIPGCLPFKPVSKPEVIKVGKKVRTIMIESQADVLVMRHFFAGLASDERRVPRGRAIGLSSVKGSFRMMFMSWFKIWTKHFPKGGWNEFLGWLEQQPMSESDKSAWESSTNETDGLAYLLGILLELDGVDAGDELLLARCLADYINPPVQIDGDLVYFAPWRVPSGSYLTAHGNTERHWLMARWVCDYFQEHGGAGTLGCTCRWCRAVGHVAGFGERLSELQLDMLRAYFVMGDDFIGFAYGSTVFDALMDEVFGTTTNSTVETVFGGPGKKSVEFLRKQFILDKTFNTWNVRTFRQSERVLAKIFHGSSRRRQSDFKAGLLSAVWDVGANRELYCRLVSMLRRLGAVNPVEVRDKLKKLVKRNPALAETSPDYIPEYSVVLNSDGSLLSPLEKVWWTSVYEENGLHLNRF